MSKNTIQQLVQDATIGLKGDPELQIDIQEELRSHLDAGMEEQRAAGKNEQESLKYACKTFGSPMEMAAEIVDANRKRMKLRAIVRLTTRVLLVPASIVVAMMMGTSVLLPYRTLSSLGQRLGLGIPFVDSRTEYAANHVWPNLSKADCLILDGNLSRPTKAEQQKAIWEAYPTNKVFYGNYITYCYRNISNLTDLEQVLAPAGELDPGNARYHYLRAEAMLKQACELKDIPGDRQSFELVIKNRSLLDAAMAEFQKGRHQPFLNTYSFEMLAQRLAILPESRTLTEEMDKVSRLAGVLLPECATYRHLARVSILYARQLIHEGKPKEALPFLESCYPLTQQIFDRSFSLIELLVGSSILRIEREQAVPLLYKIGENKKAEALETKASRLLQIFQEWRIRVKNSNQDSSDILSKRAGMLAGMLLPSLGESISAKELATSRYLEFTIMERVWICLFVALFVFLLLGTWIISCVWRWRQRHASAPLLLLPDAMYTVKMLLISVVLPLGLYFLWTRYSGWAAREYSIRYRGWQLILELSIVTAAILYSALFFAIQYVYRRCRDLNIAKPNRPTVLKILILALIPFGLFIWLCFSKEEHRLFYGTVARSLLPVFSSAIILIVVITHPFLSSQETRLLQKDPIIFGMLHDREVKGLTKLEAKVIQKLKNEIKDATQTPDSKP